ncbi:hypothetical protein M8C21_031998, partial [Ambrosia artemisiifolia]
FFAVIPISPTRPQDTYRRIDPLPNSNMELMPRVDCYYFTGFVLFSTVSRSGIEGHIIYLGFQGNHFIPYITQMSTSKTPPLQPASSSKRKRKYSNWDTQKTGGLSSRQVSYRASMLAKRNGAVSSNATLHVHLPACASSQQSCVSLPASVSSRQSYVPSPACVSSQQSSVPMPACVSSRQSHVPLPACVSSQQSHVPLPVCVSSRQSSVPSPACASSQQSHVPSPACASSQQSHVPLPACVSTQQSHVPLPACASSRQSPVPLPAYASSQQLPVPLRACASSRQSPVPLPACASSRQSHIPSPACASSRQSPVPLPVCASSQQSPVPSPACTSSQQSPVPLPACASSQQSHVPLPSCTSSRQSPVPLPACAPSQQSHVPSPACVSSQQSPVPLPACPSSRQSHVPLPACTSSQQSQTPIKSPSYIHSRDCNLVCQYCGSYFWHGERVISFSTKRPVKFIRCCKGAISDPVAEESCSGSTLTKQRLSSEQGSGESVQQSGTKDKIESGRSELADIQFEVSTEIQNNILPYVNKLRDHQNRGQNAVLFDGQDRLVKVVSFVSSLLDNITKPILIIASSSALLLWEMEFFKWSKLIKVVTYRGNKDIRAAIRGSKFQVLLSSPDSVVEDMETLEHIKWELLVIDECQCPAISTHLKKFQMLLADMRLLTVSGEPMVCFSFRLSPNGSTIKRR